MDRVWRRPSNSNNNNPATPYGQRLCKSAPCSPAKAMVKKANNGPSRADSFHVMHKVPAGDSPYVKAKHVQLVDKEPDRAIALFWAAINAGDRVDSALKDMAIVMKQQNRPEEAIEAIKSLRNRCSDQAQESLDNVLLDLYKRCGRLDDQIALLKHKLNLIHQGLAFNGKRTKTARSQGKKFQVSIEQEATRLLGNLGWAYMQQSNYIAAEAVYRKALSIELDNNKMCNLGICLMHQGRVVEAKAMLQNVKPASSNGPWGLDSHLKSYERAQEMLRELENSAVESLKSSVWQSLPCTWKHTENDQHEDEKPNIVFVDSNITTLHATSGFGPSQQNSMVYSDRDSQFSKFGNGFIEEDGFGDENENTSTSINVSASLQSRTSFGLPQDTEALRQKLDKICLKENGSAKGSALLAQSSSCRDQSGLNSAAPPFFSKHTNQRDQQSFSSNGLGPITSFEKKALLPCKRTNEHPRMPFEEKRRVLCSAINGHATYTKRPTNQIPAIPKVFLGQNLEKETRPSFLDQSLENETRPPFLGQSLQNETMSAFLGHSLQNEIMPAFTGQSLQNETLPSFLGQSLQNETMPYFLGQSLETETRPYFIDHSLENGIRTAFLGQSLHSEIRPATSASFLGPSLQDETRPSFLRQNLRNETRPATRRSLSFESIGVEFDLPPLPTKDMEMTSSNTVPFLMQDNNVADPWDTLGFIEAPDSKDFEQVTMPAISEASNAAEVFPAPQRKCHGRLRVFQEMTLPPSPKA